LVLGAVSADMRAALAALLIVIVTGCAGTAGKTAQSPVVAVSTTSARGAVLVFITAGTVSAIRTDGTVIATVRTTMDSADIARHQFDSSDAALIGHYWDQNGQPIMPLTISVFDRSGSATPVAAAAAKVLMAVDLFASPIVVGGHYLLAVQEMSLDTSRYIRLDLTTGAVTTLLTATNLPPEPLPSGALGGEPRPVQMTPLGTAGDGSLARVMVVHAAIDGVSTSGTAYYDIDLGTLKVSGPHALPNVGPLAISADGRYIGWLQFTTVPGSPVRELHVRDLVTGAETTMGAAPFVNEAAHAGIRFSPDDSYVLVEGYGGASMGFAVFRLATHRLIQSVPANEADEPNADVPIWWTDSHTVVYGTTDGGVNSGHRLDVETGAHSDFPAELGAPVLMLG